MVLVESSCAWRTLSVILTRLRSGTDSTADSRKATLVLSGSIIKFDVGQILGDPVDLRSGVLRVACMMLM